MTQELFDDLDKMAEAAIKRGEELVSRVGRRCPVCDTPMLAVDEDCLICEMKEREDKFQKKMDARKAKIRSVLDLLNSDASIEEKKAAMEEYKKKTSTESV